MLLSINFFFNSNWCFETSSMLLWRYLMNWNWIHLSYFLFSYPRTESTAYPSSFDFRSVLDAQLNNPLWGDLVRSLLANGFRKPRSGSDAGDHPPITPMRSANEDMLGNDAWKLYQYVCQHFIGTVCPDCKHIRSVHSSFHF